MSDGRVRRAERERDRLPCRETLEAVDRERARAGDGPWLPQSGELAWDTFLAFDAAWALVEDALDAGLILGLDDDGLIRWHDPRTFDPHEDEIRAASLDAILMRNVVPVASPTQIEGWTVYAAGVGVMRSADADGVLTLSVGDEHRSQDVSRLAPNEWHRLAVTPGEVRFELASNTRGQVWLDPP